MEKRQPTTSLPLWRVPFVTWPVCAYCGVLIDREFHVCSCLAVTCVHCQVEAGGCINVECPKSPSELKR